VQAINGKLYVTYALQDADKEDDVPGAGHGFVSEFNLDGSFVRRIGTEGTLNSPWGLAIAPSSFGSLAGDLLVGNFGDGHINAFDLSTGDFVGQLVGLDGKPTVIDGLWGLIAGNDGRAGRSDTIYFTAGPGGEEHGLFGSIAAVPEPTSALLVLMGAGFASTCWRRGRSGR
jgi:uncharacterized protein (TIGR03118 family)